MRLLLVALLGVACCLARRAPLESVPAQRTAALDALAAGHVLDRAERWLHRRARRSAACGGFVEAPHPPQPIVLNHGGPVMRNAAFLSITFADNEHAPQVEDFIARF